MRTLFSALVFSALASPLALAGDTGKVAIGGGIGGALGNVIGQQVGGSTGAAIGAGLGGAAAWAQPVVRYWVTRSAAAPVQRSAPAWAAQPVARWPMNTPAAANVIAATTTARNIRSIKSTNITKCRVLTTKSRLTAAFLCVVSALAATPAWRRAAQAPLRSRFHQ